MRSLLGMLCLVVWAGPAHAGEELDRAAISAGVSKVKAAVTACEAQATTGGTVKVKVTVAPDGKVSAATAETADAALGTCVVDAMKTATFGATKSGGSFSYPFVFAAPAAAIDDVVTTPSGAPPSAAGVQPLDRQSIVSAMGVVKGNVRRCGEKAKSGGTIKVKVVVKPTGKPGAVTVEGGTAVDAKLKACTIAAVKKATFTKGMEGVFTYPFVFHSHDIQSNAPVKDPLAAPATIALDRALITAGMALVKPRIVACGDAPNPGGTIKVRVVVEPDGRVGTATVESAQDNPIADCVIEAVKTATFAITTNGGSFSYPIVFKAKKATLPVQPGSTGTAPTAENLDRAMISDGVSKAKASISACGSVAPAAKGVVKVKVAVAPSGAVSSADISQTPDKALGDCVADVLKKTAFQATKNGGSFSYPFAF